MTAVENPDGAPAGTVVYSDGTTAPLPFPSPPRVEHAWAAPYSYVGRAPAGTTADAASWRITRIELLPSGAVNVGTVQDVAWDDRETAGYV